MADTRITIDAQIQMRHDTEANWMAADPVLRVGEPAYTIGMPDRFKIGDGQRKWSELPYLTMLEEDPEGPALPALGELADVEIEQPVEGQALVYDEVRGMWVNRAVSAPDDEPESGLVFEFVYDSATNKATAEMVAALAEAIAADKLIVCNGRTYKFILEQEGMYGLVSDAYMDIMDGKLKASVLAVMSSSYDVQLMEEEVPVGTEITEATIRNWGFTKNAGTITGIMMNGATKGTSGVVDLGNVLTEHQKLKDINGQSIVGEGNITIQGGGATPRVEMTAASAAIEPNKFYVWPMMDSLDLTLGAEQSGVMNRYLFQFRNPKAGLTMLTLPDDITWSEDTELDENGLPVMEAAAFYRIEIIEGLASLKKWKLVYIDFADAEVERVLMANGVSSDGIGITKKDAAAVTSIGRWLRENADIEYFDELQFFTGLNSLSTGNVNNPGIFKNCLNLKSVIPPYNITAIQKESFFGTSALSTELSFPYLVTIGHRAFHNSGIIRVEDLGTIKELPDEANYNKWGVFSSCVNLTYVNIPSTLTIIGRYSFYGDESLDSLGNIDWGAITDIGNEAFALCSNLNVVINAPNLINLGQGAFRNSGVIRVENLGSITEFLGRNNYNNWGDFYGCINLEFFRFPATTTAIGAYSIRDCTGLQCVICDAEVPPTLGSGAFTNTNNCPIYVPDASVEAYKTALNWNTYADRIKGISEYAG